MSASSDLISDIAAFGTGLFILVIFLYATIVKATSSTTKGFIQLNANLCDLRKQLLFKQFKFAHDLSSDNRKVMLRIC